MTVSKQLIDKYGKSQITLNAYLRQWLGRNLSQLTAEDGTITVDHVVETVAATDNQNDYVNRILAETPDCYLREAIVQEVTLKGYWVGLIDGVTTIRTGDKHDAQRDL